MSVADKFRTLWTRIRQSEWRPPIAEPLPPSAVSPTLSGSVIEPNRDYFQIRINELYLRNEREWFTTYDPLLLIVSEFMYDGRYEAVPFMVGPSMLRRVGIEQTPQGAVIRNTTVAGPHPFRGGRVCVSMVLCRVVRTDYARELVQTLEGAASALDFSTGLATYLRIGEVVLDGVDRLLGFGENQPLIGMRREWSLDAGDYLGPMRIVLASPPEDRPLSIDALRVVNDRLHEQLGAERVVPYERSDFALASIITAPARSDLELLPFFSMWQKVMAEAAVPNEEGEASARANMTVLYQLLLQSPDLTFAHAGLLADQWEEQMEAIVARARRHAEKAPPTASEQADIRTRSLRALRGGARQA